MLITGESGTGKEVLARYVHGRSARAKKPFITVNCAAIPENLLESELFGHEKGAFTGALAAASASSRRRTAARCCSTKFQRNGCAAAGKAPARDPGARHRPRRRRRPVPVDIRIIATSNRNLTDAVREGKFREDLLFRLNVVNLKIPPLRERAVRHHRIGAIFHQEIFAGQWPAGPARCRRKRAARSVSIAGPAMCANWRTRCTARYCCPRGAEIGIDGLLTPDGGRLDAARGTGAAAIAAMAAEQVTRNLVGRTVAEVERDLILETLKHCLGNRTHAANILGISIRTLRNKLNEYSADGSPIPPPHGGEALRGAA